MAQTVAEMTADALIEAGIDTLYCLPGVQNDPFFDALYDRTNKIRPVHARHEQGAAYMALGAALATGRPQAFCVVPGPGFLNTTAALSTAWAVNAPVLALAGQIPSGAVGKGHGLLHEIPDQLGIMERLTKQAGQVSGGGDAAAVVERALSALISGRPGPVGLEIATDLWRQEAEGAPAPRAAPAPAPERVEEAAALLSSAKAPMIVVGGGAQDHAAEVQTLAETLGAPVLSFRNGHGVVSSEHPLSLRMPEGHDLWPEVDVVIGLGCRLQAQVMAWGRDEALKIIHIDIDPAQIGRSAQADIGINADLADALPALNAALGAAPNPAWTDRVAAVKAARAAQYAAELGPQTAWLGAIRAALPRDGLFVDELTQVGYVSRFTFPVYQPRTFISTGYQGTLGFGVPTAIGAAHAAEGRPVVGVSGDGGALFGITEFATAVHHRIPVNIVVFNDNAFGNVRRLQKDLYGARHIADSLTSPDFVALAESFGAQGLRAETPEALEERLSQAIAHDGPSLIEVPVGEMPSPWGFVLMEKLRAPTEPDQGFPW